MSVSGVHGVRTGVFGFALGEYLTIVLAFRIVSTLIPVRRGLPPVKSSRVSLLGRRLVYQIYPCFPRPGLLTTALPSANDRVDALALFHVEACETRLSVVGSCFVDRFIHVRCSFRKVSVASALSFLAGIHA